MGCIQSLLRMDIFSKTDTIVQMARCSFDIHVADIVGALVIGASLIMLHPQGTMDLSYLVHVLQGCSSITLAMSKVGGLQMIG